LLSRGAQLTKDQLPAIGCDTAHVFYFKSQVHSEKKTTVMFVELGAKARNLGTGLKPYRRERGRRAIWFSWKSANDFVASVTVVAVVIGLLSATA